MSPDYSLTKLTCNMQVKTHISKNNHILYFLPIMVSFLTYLVIFTHDKTLLIFQPSLTYKLKQDSCSIHIWVTAYLGESPSTSPGISPRYCLLSTFNELYPFIFYRHYTMAEYAFFMQKADQWRKDMVPL